jgi:tyrosyl-tRNA synthetase
MLAELARSTDQITTPDELEQRLASGRPLRIKYGVDCTAPFLHLGHAVNLWPMRALQDRGHIVIFLLGDVTTAVGDPTGRSTTRPVLAAEEIDRNAQAFLDQVSLVLRTDPEVFEVRRNSQWYNQMSVPQWLSVLATLTQAQLMARDMFRQRLAEGRDIAMHELCYPVLQAYDSVVLRSDLTIVGSDQLFNEMLGRQLQQRAGQPPQVVITTTVTAGIDGQAKQSKSLNNFIGLTDTPRDKFGKAMSLPDRLIADYLRVYTEVPMALVERARTIAPGPAARDLKLTLAHAVVARYHGQPAADAEREWFLRTFTQRATPSDLESLPIPAGATVFEVVRLARPSLSGNQARRLIADGAIRLDGQPLTDPAKPLVPYGNPVLQVGRRRWLRLTERFPE